MILDLIVVLFTAFGFYLGYKRGLIRTVFDTLSFFIGALLALKFAPFLIKHVDQLLNVTPAVSYLIGLVIAFIIVIGVIGFIGKQIENVFKAININFINKIVGGVVQGLFFAFILSMALLLLGNMKILNEDIKNTSQTYVLIEPLPEVGKDLFEKARPILTDFWDLTKETIDNIKTSPE